MSERTKASLRIVLVMLVVANVLFFAYSILAPDERTRNAARIDELQINPGRVRIIDSATRGPAGQPATAKSGKSVYRACLEWGPFAAADAARAESALARLALTSVPVQRPVNAPGGGKRVSYFVREPDAPTVAQIADLQRAFPGTEIKAGPCPG